MQHRTKARRVLTHQAEVNDGNPPAGGRLANVKERTEGIVDTLAVFHFEMSLLNVGLLENSEAMLVTAAVFQLTMLPYVVVAVVGLVTHAVTAVPMLPSVMHKAHVTEPAVHA